MGKDDEVTRVLEPESIRYDRFWRRVSRGILIATFVVVGLVIYYIKVNLDAEERGRQRADQAVKALEDLRASP
jgi:tetrahydromethanopterin S-methyltransferase subunit G